MSWGLHLHSGKRIVISPDNSQFRYGCMLGKGHAVRTADEMME